MFQVSRSVNQQTIIFIILVIAIGAGLYFWYQYSPTNTAVIEENVTDTEIEMRLAELRRLKEIKLDTSLFQDPQFKALMLPPSVSTTTEVKPGRPNPFLPF